MKIVQFAAIVCCLLCSNLGIAQHPADPNANFHAGVHSGSWTLRRGQLLEQESQDPYRACADPYCARCAKHLADYGHEYQYLGGPDQRQAWYRGTAGSVAVVTQRGYDQHGIPYARRGQPASAIMSWEYRQALNHAIWEQVNARNAVACEEAASDRVAMLTKLLGDAQEQLRLTKEAWEEMEKSGKKCVRHATVAHKPVSPCIAACKKTRKEFADDLKAGRTEAAKSGLCEYCLAKERYLFDQAYVADVSKELTCAGQDWERKSVVADEAVRIALLSKADAERATRFKRIQYKPPKYQEVLAARGETSGQTEPVKEAENKDNEPAAEN
jgi:hypothetical protein